MGLPMIPKPMKPIRSDIVHLISLDAKCSHLNQPASVGRHPCEAVLGRTGWVIFQADRTGIAELVGHIEDVVLIQLAGTRLGVVRHVGHLNMATCRGRSQ